MHILVTGGSGHIGRSIVAELVTAGHQVLVADRQAAEGLGTPFQLVDLEDLDQVLRVARHCEAIVHAAAIPRPGGCPDHVLFRTNMMTLFHVLEACRMLAIPRFVWTSSMSVFGFPFNPRPIPLSYLPIDDAHPQDPQEPYALSKALGEQLVASYAARCELTAISLRVVWAHTPATFVRDLVPFWQNPAAGAANLWSYVDTRDCGRAVTMAVACSTPGHHACLISAADTCMPVPTHQLVEQYLPGAPAFPSARASHAALFDTAQARMLLGYEPAYHWRMYGIP